MMQLHILYSVLDTLFSFFIMYSWLYAQAKLRSLVVAISDLEGPSVNQEYLSSG